MKAKSLLKNEEGSVMVLALIILVLMTMMGISMTTTSSIEVQIAGNNMIYKENLYKAEGSAMFSAQVLENETDKDALIPDSDTAGDWLHDELPNPTVSNSTNWNDTNSEAVDGDEDNRYIVVREGFARGSSLDMTSQSQVHEYSVYGLSRRKSGRSIVLVGFRKRF